MIKNKYINELKSLEDGLAPSSEAGIFGSPYSAEDASIVLLACPWEATASFGTGTSLGPQNIFAASHQLDLEHPVFGAVYKKGLAMDQSLEEDLLELNSKASALVGRIRENNFSGSKEQLKLEKKVNYYSQQVNQLVYKTSLNHLQTGKKVCLVGGDHSSSFGLVKAVAEFDNQDFSILHIDAHFDLRKGYEGFKHSHASIMFNLAESFTNIKKFTHVAIRDYCKAEIDWTRNNLHRSQVFLDYEIQRRILSGESFSKIGDVEVLGKQAVRRSEAQSGRGAPH